MASAAPSGGVGAASAMSHEAVGQLLSQALAPTTAKAATEAVKLHAKDPNFVIALVLQCCQNPDSGVRQLAAVLLRRRIYRVWSALSGEHQSEVKKLLIDRLTLESERIVRLSIAHLIASVMRASFGPMSDLRNTDMFFVLSECVRDGTEGQQAKREAALTVLRGIIGDVSFGEADSTALLSLFEIGLRDASANVRAAAVKGVEAMVGVADTKVDFENLRKVLPLVVDVTRRASEEGDDECVAAALTLFDTLAEHGNFFKATDIPDMLRFMASCVCANTTLAIGVREQAFSFIHTAAKAYPKCFTADIIHQIISLIVPMLSEADDNADEDEDELSPHKVAAQCVDGLALNLPTRNVFEPMVKALTPAVESADPWKRRGAIIALGIMSEGCEDVMRFQLSELLPPILNALRDPNEHVRSAGAIALGQFAEYLQPDICRAHGAAMDVLMNGLQAAVSDVNEKMCEKLCYALELFCENLHESEIALYVGRLIPVLLLALQKVERLSARNNCVGALSSVASASRNAFRPYVDAVFDVLAEAMRQTVPDLLPLRARATTCAGIVADSLPNNLLVSCRPKIEVMTQTVLEGLRNIDNYQAREASYRFLGSVAHCLNDEFAPLLPTVMPYIFASLKNMDGVVAQYDEDEQGNFAALEDGDDVEDDDGRRVAGYSVRTAFLDEQEAAVALLCCLFQNISSVHMSSWLQQTTEQLQILQHHFHEEIRQQVPAVAQAVLLNVYHANLPDWAPRLREQVNFEGDPIPDVPRSLSEATSSDNRGWEAGIPSRFPIAAAPLRLWMDSIYPILLEMLRGDDSKAVVSDVCSALGELLELMGPGLLTGDMPAVLFAEVCSLLKQEHVVFHEQVIYDLDDDADSRAIEEYLFEGVSQLITGLAQALGSEQFPATKLHPLLRKLATHKKSMAYRSIGIGCYAELFKAMKAGAAGPLISDEIILAAISGAGLVGDSSNQRNSAYCLGVLCQVGAASPAVQARLPQIVDALIPLVGTAGDGDGLRESEWAVRDNAVAALGRILRSSQQLLGVNDNLFLVPRVVEVFLANLPLKADFEETQNILLTLSFLYNGGVDRSLLGPHQTNFLRGLLGSLGQTASVSASVRQQCNQVVSECVQALGADNPLVAGLANENPAWRTILEKSIRT